jgi:hypothetical protein
VGSFSKHQGCDQNAYVAGSVWKYPEFYTYFRWHVVRCQCARSNDPRACDPLCDGPRRSQFRTSRRIAQSRCILCHSGQIQCGLAVGLLGSVRSSDGRLRSDVGSIRLLLSKTLSSLSASNSPQRPRDPETQKTIFFPTDLFGPPHTIICELYKARWQVELIFKWIKQYLRIKKPGRTQ